MEGLTRNKLNALARIAAVDGEIAAEEIDIIYKIAEEHGYSRENVKYIIDNPEPLGDFEDLNEHDRLEFMFIALNVMQADDLIYQTEIKFCKALAEKLRIDPVVVDLFGTRSDLSIVEFNNQAKQYVQN